MLRQRVITALALLALLLPALFYSSVEPFALLGWLLIVAAGWEWARLNGGSPAGALASGMGLGLLLAGFWLADGLHQNWRMLWLLVSVCWVLMATVMFRRGPSGWTRWPKALRLGGGLFLLACAWVALVQARLLGLGFLLSVLTLVWMADIAAYAGGRTFGRRKLAPSISPGKSWEGVFSGVAGVLLLALGWRWLDMQGLTDQPSVFSRLWAMGAWVALPALLFITAMSVVGDLVESLVKRGAGMKDSSQLLPGHGGVLDRIDALLPVLPLAMMFATF